MLYKITKRKRDVYIDPSKKQSRYKNGNGMNPPGLGDRCQQVISRQWNGIDCCQKQEHLEHNSRSHRQPEALPNGLHRTCLVENNDLLVVDRPKAHIDPRQEEQDTSKDNKCIDKKLSNHQIAK